MVAIAIDALAIHVITEQHIVVDDLLIKVREIALSNAQFFVGDV